MPPHAKALLCTDTVTHLGLLRLSWVGAIIILSATVSQHLGHGDGAAWEVGVVVQALPHLQTAAGQHTEGGIHSYQNQVLDS